MFSLYNTRGKKDIELAKNQYEYLLRNVLFHRISIMTIIVLLPITKSKKETRESWGQSQKDSVYASVAEPVLEKIDPLEYIDSEMKITKEN